jgi:hypothetical protein
MPHYEQLDRHFPGIRAQYEQHFRQRYGAPANRAYELETLFTRLCRERSIATRVKRYEAPHQMRLF